MAKGLINIVRYETSEQRTYKDTGGDTSTVESKLPKHQAVRHSQRLPIILLNMYYSQDSALPMKWKLCMEWITCNFAFLGT